jgi:methyltransferase family protein
MAARILQMAQLVSLALRLAGIDSQARCLDYGGGNGLFCRMMRDQGFDFWNYDKYVTPFYCSGFVVERPTTPFAVITAFEVFEHLAQPARDIDEIFGLEPNLWIFSTQLYRDQGADWDYLARTNGRHVFFYTARALEGLAARRGYVFIPGRQIHAFIKSNADGILQRPFARAAIKHLLEGNRAVALAAVLNFSWQQRYAFRRWRADRDRLRSGALGRPSRPTSD